MFSYITRQIEASKSAQQHSLESENERLFKKLGELQRRQHEFNFLIHNQEHTAGRRIPDDVISVAATDNSDSNAREIELLNRKLEDLTTRHSKILSNLKEHSLQPLPVASLEVDTEHPSDYSDRD